MLRPLARLASLALLLNACSASYGEGIGHYRHARYPEAAEALAEVENDASRWTGHDRARYALYRGLTHLALGDRAATARWLGEAKRAVDADPRLLDDEESGRLASAWAHLEP